MAPSLLDGLAEVRPVAAKDRASAQATLDEVMAAARRALPDGLEDPDGFVRFVGARLTRDGAASQALSTLAAGDLALAWGCLHDHPESLAALDRLLRRAIAGLPGVSGSHASPDDLAQLIRQKLLVGDAPKLSQYTGRGNLAAWLRAVAARAAISLARPRREEPQEEERVERALSAPDPELQYIRQQFREPFRAAFQSVMTAMPSDQRALLQLHFVDGLSHEQIARLQRVHQTTATRRIAAARKALQLGIRQHLKAHLQLKSTELDSLLREVRSELEVSLGALLPGPDA